MEQNIKGLVGAIDHVDQPIGLGRDKVQVPGVANAPARAVYRLVRGRLVNFTD